jgi:hypothetical protein
MAKKKINTLFHFSCIEEFFFSMPLVAKSIFFKKKLLELQAKIIAEQGKQNILHPFIVTIMF